MGWVVGGGRPRISLIISAPSWGLACWLGLSLAIIRYLLLPSITSSVPPSAVTKAATRHPEISLTRFTISKKINNSPDCHHQPYLIHFKLVHYYPWWLEPGLPIQILGGGGYVLPLESHYSRQNQNGTITNLLLQTFDNELWAIFVLIKNTLGQIDHQNL